MGDMNSFNVQFSFVVRSMKFSNQLAFNLPLPGQIHDFGEVTMRDAGNLNGRLKDDQGNWLANLWISFRQEGSTGEGNWVSGQTDENGNFTLQGPPSTSLSNMKGSVWIGNTEYVTELMTLNFPASGANRNLGTVVVSPAP
jgi:hypothetical protein